MTDNVFSTEFDPEQAASVAQELLKPDGPVAPVIESPAPGFVRLPGGLVTNLDMSTALYDAEVRELNGSDEEFIDRVRRGKASKTNEAILERGVKTIGDRPAPKHVIRDLLLGDAMALLIEIRRSTYGADIEYEGLVCPHCREKFDLSLSVEDIPVIPLKNSADRLFDVPLRGKNVAHVRLPRLSDIPEGTDDTTSAEYNTMLLSRLVLSVENTDTGNKTPVSGSLDAARNLGTADRSKILKELGKRQIGPKLDEVKFTHDMCGEEVPFPISMGDLFPGL